MTSYGVFWKKNNKHYQKAPPFAPFGRAIVPKRINQAGINGAIILTALAVLSILQSFVSCATVPYVQKEEKVVKLVELINRGGVNEVPGLASTPFLIDGEIVLLQKDLSEFWENLHKNGFSIRSPKVVQNRFVRVEDAKVFRDSMEVRTFLKKYVDRDTSLVQVQSADGTYYFLLSREVKGYPRMLGFGGPVR